MFNIYGSTIEKEYETIFAPIEFEWDAEGFRGRMRVPGVVDLSLTPILNPVTGKEHRIALHLPDGFEFKSCSIASSTFVGEGDISYRYEGRYGQIWCAAYGPQGIIESESHRLAFR